VAERARGGRASRVRVIACGNPEAADDAAGLLAVRRARPLLERFSPAVEIVEAGPGLRLLDLLEGPDAVVVVDAMRTPRGARQPGEVVRAEAGPEGLPAIVASSISSHGFGVADVVGLAGVLGSVPRLVFFGVEAADVTPGHPLSGPVADALPSLTDLIAAEVNAMLESVP
jgi:hydrogenase maturation protease